MKLLLLFSLFANFAIGQTISGYVHDEAEDKPLEGAFVYIDGTTLSASTDAKGFFRIVSPQKYNAALVISYIGFETLRIDNPAVYEKPFKALLTEDAISLGEVVINKPKGPFSRKDMLRVFREEFLGRSSSGTSCKIENEDDVRLYYDINTNTLHAESKKPLRIINKRLHYTILFDLAAFEVNYFDKSLSSSRMASSFYAGTTFFTDTSKKGKADKVRKETYLGSMVHLMKTIVDHDWKQQKFQFYAGQFPADPKKYLTITDSLNFKKVALDYKPSAAEGSVNVTGLNLGQSALPAVNPADRIRLSVLYDKNWQSFFEFNRRHFYVDENGLFFPITALTFGGYVSTLKAGDLLPADYMYTE